MVELVYGYVVAALGLSLLVLLNLVAYGLWRLVAAVLNENRDGAG